MDSILTRILNGIKAIGPINPRTPFPGRDYRLYEDTNMKAPPKKVERRKENPDRWTFSPEIPRTLPDQQLKHHKSN